MKRAGALLLVCLFLLTTLTGIAQDSAASSRPLDTTNQNQAIAQQASDSLARDTTSNQSQSKKNILINTDQAVGFTFTSFYRGVLGMLVVLLLAFLFSSNRKAINWRVVAIGLGIQLILAIGVLTVPFVQQFFEFISKIFVKILSFTEAGSEFLLGDLMDTETFGYIFAFQVLPTIIFFSALTSVLFYLGIIQKIVYALAWVMTRAMRLSGAESLSVAGNIFLGQTESPLMIKPYLEKMSRSEILLVMLGGMATLAGGVLAAYISFLGSGDKAQELLFAKHLLAASIMAAPGAVVIAKILVPQTETINKQISITKDRIGSNFLEAMTNGTTEGFKLAANVAAMLLVFVAFIAMFNFIVAQMGQWSLWVLGVFLILSFVLFRIFKQPGTKATAVLGLLFIFIIGFNYIWADAFNLTSINSQIAELTDGDYKKISLEFILGYTFAPLVWLLGVAHEDMTLVGRLLGEKIIASEFIGYISLAELKNAGAFEHYKSIIMATYMLAGFANFASIGIQIGGIGSLAPGRKTLLSKFGIKALIGGTLASLMSATIVGMILG